MIFKRVYGKCFSLMKGRIGKYDDHRVLFLGNAFGYVYALEIVGEKNSPLRQSFHTSRFRSSPLLEYWRYTAECSNQKQGFPFVESNHRTLLNQTMRN